MSTVTHSKVCAFCGKIRTFKVKAAEFQRWIDGEHVQDIWPDWSADDRETWISGSCGPCFDTAFGGEE